MIDTHCHLNFHSFKKDYHGVARAAYDAGVTKIINAGAKLDSSRRAIKIAEEIPYCFAAVGIHPHHAEEYYIDSGSKGRNDKVVDVEKELSEMIEKDKKEGKKIVAIGECGLDYHFYSVGEGLTTLPMGQDISPVPTEKIKKTQIELLKLHIKLAQKYSLPLIIHCREAYSDLISLLQTTDYRLPTPSVIHCFQGSLDALKQFLDSGFYIGYDGFITYCDKNQKSKIPACNALRQVMAGRKNQNNKSKFKNNHNICVDPQEISDNLNISNGTMKQWNNDCKLTKYEELVLHTPIDKLLTETDSPWLTPEPFRGKRNEPKNIKIICEKIAEIKKISIEEVNDITTKNAEKIFRI